MTDNEIISALEMAKAEVEWEYPLDYFIALDGAIKAISDRQRYKDEVMKLQTYKLFSGDTELYVSRDDVIKLISGL